MTGERKFSIRKAEERKHTGMTRTEFIETLRNQLVGEVSEEEIENTIRYYQEYISEAMRQGKTEAQVLEELGSPNLIARTVIDMAKENGGKSQNPPFSGRKEGGEPGTQNPYSRHAWSDKGNKAAAILILAALLILVVTILRILIPLAVPILVIWMIYRLIKGGKNG